MNQVFDGIALTINSITFYVKYYKSHSERVRVLKSAFCTKMCNEGTFGPSDRSSSLCEHLYFRLLLDAQLFD